MGYLFSFFSRIKPKTRRRFLVNLLLVIPVFILARLHQNRKDGLSSEFASPDYGQALGEVLPDRDLRISRESLPFTVSEKVMLQVVKNEDGSISDVTPDERILDGKLLREANGRTYRAYYWINNVRWQHPDGSPKLLQHVMLAAGQVIHIKKVWAEDQWVSNFDQLYLRQPEVWYENSGADELRTFKTITTILTT